MLFYVYTVAYVGSGTSVFGSGPAFVGALREARATRAWLSNIFKSHNLTAYAEIRRKSPKLIFKYWP